MILLRRSLILAFFILLTCAGASEGAEKIILVTGFEPFGGERTNASWEAVKDLNDRDFGGAKVVSAKLPVLWEKAATKLQELVKRYHPAAVICFGEGLPGPVRLERTARNQRCDIADNEGIKPASTAIYPSSARSLQTALPVEDVKSKLTEAGIPSTISIYAGTFVCNEAFYTLLKSPGTEGAQHILRGLIHLPPLNARVQTTKGSFAVFDRALLQRTAQIAIESALEK